MNTFHLSGYPRIGAKRELKFAVEAFWKGDKTEAELQAVAADIRSKNWAAQKAAGADLLPVGDFSFYDHVLDLLCTLGAIPKRFGFDAANLSLPEYFQLAPVCDGNDQMVRYQLPLHRTRMARRY